MLSKTTGTVKLYKVTKTKSPFEYKKTLFAFLTKEGVSYTYTKHQKIEEVQLASISIAVIEEENFIKKFEINQLRMLVALRPDLTIGELLDELHAN